MAPEVEWSSCLKNPAQLLNAFFYGPVPRFLRSGCRGFGCFAIYSVAQTSCTVRVQADLFRCADSSPCCTRRFAAATGLQTPRLASRVLVPNFGLLLVGLGCARTDQFSRVADRDPENVYREQTAVRYYRSQHLCVRCAGNDGVRFRIVASGIACNLRYYRDRARPGSPEHPGRCLLGNITEH